MPKMKTFEIKTYETERWERVYLVKASSEKSALKKFYKDTNDSECIDGEMIDVDTTIDYIEEANYL